MLFVFGNLSAQDWGDVEDWEWDLYPPSEIADEPAMIIFDKGEMKVDLSGISLIRHVRIKVFDKDNIDDVAAVDISYDDDEKFSEFEAHTILPSGEKKKVRDKFEKEAGDTKTLTFTFPAVTNGSILEYKYQISNERFGFLGPWYFQNDIYTLKSIFSVTYHPDLKYEPAPRHLPPNKQRPRKEADRSSLMTRYIWELDSLKPAKPEPLAGSVINYLPSIHYQLSEYDDGRRRVPFMTSWIKIGKWISEGIEDFIDEDEKLAELAGSLTRDAHFDDEKISSIYSFVRDSIKTSGSGMFGFWTESCSDLLKNKSGSATAKNLLLTALLQEAGFKAYPLLIATRGYGIFNPYRVQISQFDHLICYVNLQVRECKLDAGKRSVAFPYLPAYDLVDRGLLIEPVSTRPITLLPPPDRTSSTQLKANINLREDGSAACSTFICVQGYENARYDDYLLDTISQLQIATDMLAEFELNYDVDEAVSRYFPEGDSLSIKLMIEIPEFASALGDHMLISPFLIPLVDNPFKSEERQYPIDFQYEFTRYHEITINHN
jgi:hypothetical protein